MIIDFLAIRFVIEDPSLIHVSEDYRDSCR